MKTNGAGARAVDFLERLLAHRHLPAALAVAAVLVVLPALPSGLGMDDLPQRAVELRPDQLPARMHATGNPADSGSLPTVLRDLFYHRIPSDLALERSYGGLPWWTPDDFTMGLWRPVTAFTHWLDYRLFPDSAVLMHAHNIAWFAAIVFLVTLIYRRLMGAGWAAGLAALLFLLDANTYGPVAYVANRGFLLSLFFGVGCLLAHHQWRSGKSRFAGGLSALLLALSLFADEGGASTLAFILAYALVLEPGSLRQRALTVLPAILVIIGWRIVYNLSGVGITHMGIYTDPLNEPLQFARQVAPNALVMLGGQLSGVPPDLMLGVNPLWQTRATALFCLPVIAALAVFLPWVRRDKTAAFWLAVMLLAAIPVATGVPFGKNLGFVAVGAYGLIASFMAGLIDRPGGWPSWRAGRILAWTAGVLLLLAHVPLALLERFGEIKFVPHLLTVMDSLADVGDSRDAESRNVVVVNAPCPFILFEVPAYKAFHHRPLPGGVRALAPGWTGLDLRLTDDKTLIIQSQGPDIFSCDDFGILHPAYAISGFNLLVGRPTCKKGDRHNFSNLTVEVLEVDAAALPSRVAFRFDTSLDSPRFDWLRFDWRTKSYQRFPMPAIGSGVTLSGPGATASPRR